MLKKEWIFLLLSAIFFGSLFLPFFIALKVISMSVLAAFCIAFPFIRPVSAIRPFKNQLLFSGLFAAWILVSYFWSDDKADAGHFIILRLPLIILPFTLGLVTITRHLRNRMLLVFACITLLAAAISAGFAFYKGYTTGDSGWFYNDSLSFLVNQQSIYTSLLVNISIYCFAWHFWHSRSKTLKALYATAILLLVVFSFFLASRNMMAVLYCSAVALALYQVFKRRNYKSGIALLVSLVTATFLIFYFSPKTLNRFRELKFTSYEITHDAAESHYNGTLTPEQWNGANFRLAAWPCGWKLFRENPVAGVGIGDKRNELNKVYEERQFRFAIRMEKNVHNNYLDILYSLGIIGLVFFITGWFLLPAGKMIRSRDLLALWILATIAVAMITENYFDRSLGGLIVGFIVPFLLVARHHKDQETR